jgi:hypothetical protein
MTPYLKNPPPKEIYRLWYEYLKESPGFIQACKEALVHEKKMGRKATGAPAPEAEYARGRYLPRLSSISA